MSSFQDLQKNGIDFLDFDTCVEATIASLAAKKCKKPAAVLRLGSKWRLRFFNQVPLVVANAMLSAIEESKRQDIPENDAIGPLGLGRFPVECGSFKDIQVVAKEMQAAASKEIDEGEYQASATEFEAHVKAENIGENMIKEGILRFLFYRGMFMNCVLTSQWHEGKLLWNFSMSVTAKHKPGRVPDEIVNEMVPLFIGEKYEEVAPKAVWEEVRHFIAEV